MKRVVIESPFKATQTYTVEENTVFARKLCRHALQCGLAPYASHLFFTQPGLLNDNLHDERKLGIDAGLAWSSLADLAWFCLRPDEKMSDGMRYAHNLHEMRGGTIQYRVYSPEGEFLHFSSHREMVS